MLASYLTVVCFLDYRKRRNATYGVGLETSDSNGAESETTFRMDRDTARKA